MIYIQTPFSFESSFSETTSVIAFEVSYNQVKLLWTTRWKINYIRKGYPVTMLPTISFIISVDERYLFNTIIANFYLTSWIKSFSLDVNKINNVAYFQAFNYVCIRFPIFQKNRVNKDKPGIYCLYIFWHFIYSYFKY